MNSTKTRIRQRDAAEECRAQHIHPCFEIIGMRHRYGKCLGSAPQAFAANGVGESIRAAAYECL
jgi:hypothetical protein